MDTDVLAAPSAPPVVSGGGAKFRLNLNIVIVIILVVLIIFAAVYMYRRQQSDSSAAAVKALPGKNNDMPAADQQPFSQSRFMPPEYTPSMYMPDFVHAQMMMKPVSVPTKRVVINEIPVELTAPLPDIVEPLAESPAKKSIMRAPTPEITPPSSALVVSKPDTIVIEPFTPAPAPGNIKIVDDCEEEEDPLIIMEIEDDCESIAE